MSNPTWQQGNLIELEITGLSNSGEGLGRFQERVVFVPDTVPSDRVLVRLVRLKKQYSYGQLQEILTPSPHRIRPNCIVADKCGGCQWQHIDIDYQRASKQQQIIDALERIGGFMDLAIAPLLSSVDNLGYRNKVTYPLARSQSGQVQAGYYRRQSHHLINLNQCPVQDGRLNPFLKEIKQDIQSQGWSIYDESQQRGNLVRALPRTSGRSSQLSTTTQQCHFWRRDTDHCRSE
jgi:23S rRNA (uracil1939-C5)-methyltransferase